MWKGALPADIPSVLRNLSPSAHVGTAIANSIVTVRHPQRDDLKIQNKEIKTTGGDRGN
jgi:hypothetical protein